MIKINYSYALLLILKWNDTRNWVLIVNSLNQIISKVLKFNFNN